MLRVLLLAILLLIVARLFWRLMDSVLAAARGASGGGGGRAPAVKLVKDPVCGTFVAPRNALSLTSGGSTYYFCSEDCRAKYQQHA